MLQHVARRWGDASTETNDIFGDAHFTADFSHAMKMSLAPGPHLDAQNERMGNRALYEVNELLISSGLEQLEALRINLLEWSRHAITQASSCGVYGTQHPFVDFQVEQAFW